MKKVYVGMSGGVDSSVTASLLVEQGYQVTGVYMKNWSQDIGGFVCPWREDLADAKRVAVQLGIDFKVFDFEKQYKKKVVDYMLEGYKTGVTPNPDVMCNQEIKFKLFLDTSLEDGADMIATGHYARIKDGKLLKGKDDDKDQTYFLYRMPKTALEKTLFPLGELKKAEVRKLADDKGLVTAQKKESMGICFVGKVGIKDFLSEYIELKPGDIVDESGNKLGEHEGAQLYTIGQRHGLDVGGGLPYYVIDKNIEKNQVIVTTDLDNDKLWQSEVKLVRMHWLTDKIDGSKLYDCRSRHRAPLAKAELSISGDEANVKLKKPIRAITPGQSMVFYDGDIVLGGGIVSR